MVASLIAYGLPACMEADTPSSLLIAKAVQPASVA